MGVSSNRSCRTVRLQLLQRFGWGIGLDYHNIEWFALEMSRDHSVVFEIASKYCLSDSFVDHDGYSISSEGAVAVRAQEGLEELSHIEGQEGQR